MKQVTLNVDDNKFKAFLEFIKTLDYVKVEKTTTDKNVLQSIEQGLKEVNLIREGKIKSRSAKNFLNEL